MEFIGICINPDSPLNKPEYRGMTLTQLRQSLRNSYSENAANELIDNALAAEFTPLDFRCENIRPISEAVIFTQVFTSASLNERLRSCKGQSDTQVMDALEEGWVELALAQQRYAEGKCNLGDFPQPLEKRFELNISGFFTHYQGVEETAVATTKGRMRLAILQMHAIIFARTSPSMALRAAY